MKQTNEMTVAAARLQLDLIVKVCQRAERELSGLNISRTSLVMDLESVPELDLPRLLAAPLADFQHDILGITRNMDRRTCPGKLTNLFWPRCTLPTAQPPV